MPTFSRPRFRALLLAAAALPLSAAGCATAQPPATPEPVEETAPSGARVARPDAGEPFRLALGATADRDGHAIRFVEVVEESRCPQNVNCIQAGRAVLRIEVDGEAFDLSVPHGRQQDDEPSMIEWGEIQVVVTGLEPYPGSPDAEAGATPEAVLITRPSTV